MFGRKRMYKNGLADAMKAYEGFGKKQEEALEKIRQEVRTGNKKLETALAELGESIYTIYDLLDKKEKEALYHLHTPMDVKDLEDSEKRLLLAILFQLAEDEGDTRYNDYQRKFILSVKKYLEITNPQTETEYSSIENIDSIDIQKVFMRVILEFLYLQDEEEITDWQEEVFDYFSVNKRHAKIIECDVIRRYHILGAEGLAENYAGVSMDKESCKSEINSDNSISCTQKKQHKEIPISILSEIGFKYHLSWGYNYFEFTDCFETADYFVFFNEGIWHRYDKNSKKIDDFNACSEVISGDFSRTENYSTERTAVEYDSNRVVYVDANRKINIVNIEIDEKIKLEEIDYNGSAIQINGKYIIVNSSEGLYYIEIETQKITYIKDANGDCLRVTAATISNGSIFLYTEYGGTDNDGTDMRNAVYLYNIDDDSLELFFENKILDDWFRIKKIFIYAGCFFVLSHGKLHIIYSENDEPAADLVAEWEPEYGSEVVLDNNKLFFMEQDSFDIKMIDLDSLDVIDVVSSCSEFYEKEEKGFFSSRTLIKKRRGSYFTVGQWIYFTRYMQVISLDDENEENSGNFVKTIIYRANINRPDSPVEIKIAESVKLK